MSIRVYSVLAATAALAIWAFPGPAQAMSEQECSQMYEAAKTAGSLNGLTWNEFRRLQCSADAAPNMGAAAPVTAPQPNNNWAPAANTFAPSTSGQALSEHECSQMYEAAKAAGSLNGMTWNEFRRAQCSAGAAASVNTAPYGNATAPTATAPNVAAQPAPAPQQPGNTGNNGWTSWLQNLFPSESAPGTGQAGTGAAPTTYYGNAIFPVSVSPQYANEHIGRARELTCLDQYRANKANGGNGGLEWIQKGGGYYSECNKRLGGK